MYRLKEPPQVESIDQKSIKTNIALQSEEAYNFVLRHINKAAFVEGVYTLESRQSDARNRVIAPVFKLLGIIDQWGNGLKLIADELKDYPEIEFRWRETGLSFQVQFVKRYYKAEAEKKTRVGARVGARARARAQGKNNVFSHTG